MDIELKGITDEQKVELCVAFSNIHKEGRPANMGESDWMRRCILNFIRTTVLEHRKKPLDEQFKAQVQAVANEFADSK
jgi:hypothetical protein